MRQDSQTLAGKAARGGASPLPAWVCLALMLAAPSTGPTHATELRLKRIVYRDHSVSTGSFKFHPVADVDHDGRLEMAYMTGRIDSLPANPQRWELGRFLPFNRWEVLHSDTAPFPPPNGMHRGYFMPGEFGDFDGDGLVELVGHNWIFGDTSCPSVICALEQTTPTGLPTEPTWQYQISEWGSLYQPIKLPGDLDGDSLSDLLNTTDSTESSLMLEACGDNQVRPVWTSERQVTDYGLAFGDFDLDGRQNFVGGWSYWSGRVMVWERAGDNRYEQVWSDSVGWPNGGLDCFSGNDVNRNGKPEFFMPFARSTGGNSWKCYLYMWEMTGDDEYARVLVDSGARQVSNPIGRALCADLDADGVEEVLWNTVQHVGVYQAVTATEFERVASWNNHHRPDPSSLTINAADVNYNGYTDLLVAGEFKLSVLEVEAVRVLGPNSGEALLPGDTCLVRWETYDPPPCDSVSLFLRTDTSYRLDTIVTGLAPADTPYAWVVPDVRAESAWVMAVAFGPGWQYDECDRPLTIGVPGITEQGRSAWRQWNPPTVLHGRLLVPAGVKAVLLDPAGRRVALLDPGENDLRRLAPGVYFIRPEGPAADNRPRKVIFAR